MKIDIDAILKDMALAAADAVKDDVPAFAEHAWKLLNNRKDSLDELATARLEGLIDDVTLASELAREQQVLEAELLTTRIMAKAATQRVISAALEAFRESLRAAL